MDEVIVVTVTGDDTAKVAEATTIFNDRYVSAIGVSKRDPSDRPNETIGTNLAVGRAVRQLGRKILAETNADIRKAAHAAERQRQAHEETVSRKIKNDWRQNPVTVIEGAPAPSGLVEKSDVAMSVYDLPTALPAIIFRSPPWGN